MKCIKCGQEIMEGAAFCPFCGERIAAEPSGVEGPIYQADIKGLMKSGTLAVYRDRVEFVTSSVHKTVFNYSALVAVKKGLDRISFITEDGRTESCPVNRKNIHEAFLYIEKAVQPYLAQRKERLSTQGVRYSFPSNLGLTGGVLSILDDRAEFRGKTGQVEVVCFQDVKSAALSMGALEFSLLDGRTKAFSADKELREEVLAFVEQAIAPYIARRKEELRSRGIYFSCQSNRGAGGGTLDVLEDRVEFTPKTGQSEAVFFRDVRALGQSMGVLELFLTDGTSKAFPVEQDIWSEVLAFIGEAIRPYVARRTEGFDTSFGVDERLEVNEARGVFHILRQNGSEITDELPLDGVARCEQTECGMSNGMLGGVLSGGRAILNSAAKAVGAQNTAGTGEIISYVGVLLTVRTEEEEQTLSIRFGDFPLGISRTNKKYDRYLAEVARFMDYLAAACPECERIVPAPPEPQEEPAGAAAAAGPAGAEVKAIPAPAETAGSVEEAPETGSAPEEADQFGITKYLEGVSGFIDECTTPMTIAIQGGWGSGKNSIMHLLASSLTGRCQENLIWFNTWQFSQFDLGEQLPMVVGNRLISHLNGTNNAANKDRAIKMAKGLINITSGFISQGTTDGQNLMDALFKDNSTDSLEKLARTFSALVKKRAGGEDGKVVIFVDDLDRLAPAKAVELLEAMRNFFDCEGCVFVIAADYNSIIRGVQERYGQDLDEGMKKRFFKRLFQVSFRVPASGFNIKKYVTDKLARIEIYPDSEQELTFYVDLIRHSIGGEPESMDRLFNSFLLLKKLADRELYENRDRRLMLFSLLCMQMRFQEIYDLLVRTRDTVTPAFLTGLCSRQSEALAQSQLSDDEKTQFCEFAQVFCDVINIDREESISDSECGIFSEVLEFSSITSE